MSADDPTCTRCGGQVGIDEGTGQPWPLCGRCWRGVERGLCIDCGGYASRIRCGPCHQRYKAARDRPTPVPRPPRVEPAAFTVTCVRCGEEIGIDRPRAVTPVCDRCKIKAEDAKATDAKSGRARKGPRRGRQR